VLAPRVVKTGGGPEAGPHHGVNEYPSEGTRLLGGEAGGNVRAPLALARPSDAVVEGYGEIVVDDQPPVGSSELLGLPSREIRQCRGPLLPKGRLGSAGRGHLATLTSSG